MKLMVRLARGGCAARQARLRARPLCRRRPGDKPGMDEIETQPHYYENSFEALVARYLSVE